MPTPVQPREVPTQP